VKINIKFLHAEVTRQRRDKYENSSREIKKIKALVTEKQNMKGQLNCRILLKVALTSTTHEVLPD
jgi:hypothetical protein